MQTSDYDKEPCGIRLVRLINAHSLEIARRELQNTNKMCLYGTGTYWTGFEHSAYFLSKLFPKAEPFIVNNPNTPFTIVGVSVSVKDFNKYKITHTAIHKKEDYIEYEVDPFIPSEYRRWHLRKINGFKEVINEYNHQKRHMS